jgi:hypothetical protein
LSIDDDAFMKDVRAAGQQQAKRTRQRSCRELDNDEEAFFLYQLVPLRNFVVSREEHRASHVDGVQAAPQR